MKQIRYYCPNCKEDKHWKFSDDLVPNALMCSKCGAGVWKKGEVEIVEDKTTIADSLKVQIEQLARRIEKIELAPVSEEEECSTASE